jgi:hypothetical protein
VKYHLPPIKSKKQKLDWFLVPKTLQTDTSSQVLYTKMICPPNRKDQVSDLMFRHMG